MLTVGSLVEECGLELAAGDGAAASAVRWVHTSEHEDPTPWLSGGEVLLTTGYNLGSPAKQRRYVELLAAKEIAGLGFGTGFDHKRLPKALLDAARTHDLPLFEVPYEMPFIAINERAAAHLVNEQFDVLDRGTQVHERLERLVIEGRGLEEILASTAAAIGGGRDRLRRPAAASSRAVSTAPRRVPRTPRRCRPELAAYVPNGSLAAFAPERHFAGRALAVPVPWPAWRRPRRLARGRRRSSGPR